MELLSSNSKKIQEMEAPKKKFLICQGTETLKSFLYFRKWNLSVHPEKISYISGNRNAEKNLYISGNGNLKKRYTSGNKTFLYFRKRYFLIFKERHSQNPDILRTKVYSKSETYTEHWQISTMESFAKISCQAHFSASAS